MCFSGPFAASAQSWSSDGHTIVLPGRPLVLVDPATLSPEPRSGASAALPGIGAALPGLATGTLPSLSPDGSKIAFLAFATNLTILDLTTRRSVTADTSAVSRAAWSPDSKFLAYVHKDDKGGLELRTLHDNGDIALPVSLPFQKLATGGINPVAWVPSTDNVIVAGGDGARTDLYLVDQGQVVPLTTTGDVLGFAVSGTGERVRWIMKSRNTHYILFSIYDLEIGKRTLSKVDFPDRLPLVNPQPRRSVDTVLSAVISPDLLQIAFLARGGPTVGSNSTALFATDLRGARVVFVERATPTAPVQPGPPPERPDNGAPPPPPALPAPVAPGGPPVAPPAQDAVVESLPFTMPMFSPDSRQVALVRTQGEKRTLLIVRLATGQRTAGLLP